MPSFEIEIKSLLGSKENADKLLDNLKKDPSFQAHGTHKQLNHYFIPGDLNTLAQKLNLTIPDNILNSKNFSVRTADRDGKVLFVIKATVDDTTSANGTARAEFEQVVDMSLDQLDKTLLDSGFKYQAKWSRERQDFKYKDMSVSIDKNAGYGYLVEFEKVIEDPSKADETKTFIRDSMQVLGVEELKQDRLERMFAHYNQNWQDYYGTEKVFNIE
ncbi:MAG: hypothetical protein A3I07_00570 [Candidatus Doudnabacteria bacterium RIFCSPLOWO2_02_FULL_42_9]|uniref:CYTH domain-containing protein n=1 Tax=Candidatus Doudnabacteria bacterium RIFCSPHIGHO2_01_FULL_41_86 TaxID=1817821 RepID=A0A1F5N8A0_9BACT|nr:MAG: hypothetical protein A2717_04400 [Candidatus Doudnabacteria bacterium RIFCSPHIGHO2_01_FULL_41_86]OGE75853.1 MAG: hypothetical protein A3K07_03995 [Candidatus Doudnabacteria bacterium RIFCSPHIGHO2_01_43_10]OGE86227.1 MAG: hypothetical protein A3E28_03755 [Candidatus Doudnabacteria bacterium RIFCSPHIGHO2_12_FULL_42_22]OGE87076.1 MAG: hypothetical protein A3C49_03425 [Candidatus Doudnabacteria bacterium RIFCSPHIGHO2_02_FULL_42_25]OGE92215.1 MAG: hypothetical protein A2895_04105 [Candidatus